MKNVSGLIFTAALAFFATADVAQARTIGIVESDTVSTDLLDIDALPDGNKEKCEKAQRDLTTAEGELANAEEALRDATTPGAKKSAEKRVAKANEQIKKAKAEIAKYC